MLMTASRRSFHGESPPAASAPWDGPSPCRLARTLLASLPLGPRLTSVRTPAEGACATGLVEGWRGPVFLALEAGPGEGSEFTVRLAALPEPAIPGYLESPAGGSTGIPAIPSTQST